MDIQRLRNLTTRKLHTEMGHIYDDLERLTGVQWFTHMLPGACNAVEPWLRKHVTDSRFWDGEYDTAHTGDYVLPDPTEADRAAMIERYRSQPDLLAGRDVIGVITN